MVCYGSAGSGKTHSIMGVAEDPGILPRSLAEFFDCMADPTLLEEKLEEANEIESGENGGFSAGSKKEGFEEGENRVNANESDFVLMCAVILVQSTKAAS